MNRTSDNSGGAPVRVGILHGAGYVGRETIGCVLRHPGLELVAVTSSTFAGQPLHVSHPSLRGVTDLRFSAELDVAVDAIFVTAGHGQSASAVGKARDAGFDGVIVDLSADFRYPDVASYEKWIGAKHTRPDLLPDAVYSMPEITGDLPDGARLIANPGCFATGQALALWPLSQHLPDVPVAVTALTGASGSGASPKPGTHFPDRDGNVKAYKVLQHQHAAEISRLFPDGYDFSFVPVSGPWTRGIWGTAQVQVPGSTTAEDGASWFEGAYGQAPLIRLSPGELPELLPVVNTPFADIGWVLAGRRLVVGFAIDNLMKGAASQAVQNLNLALGLPGETGLLP
ncbi:MAG: N-acetyl-gamma-glutamyl-phosphate reductase [Rhodothermales bacterium]|nr:N-acetyl-gamma-glutamyl-phosphate reductase [Rhodothermales bacterium]